MSACQGGSGPAKVGKEGLEKDTESDVGANPCRLDCKAGGYNEIAIKQGGFFHRSKESSFRNVENKSGT